MINKEQIKQQREAIDSLYELVKNAPASERKDSAMAYCEGCIAACDLGLKVLNGKKTEAPKTEETPKVEEPTVTEEPKAEEKPKRKRTTKKKEPVEEDDLDDLL